MNHLVYIAGPRGPSPQKIPAGPNGRLFIDEGIRGRDLASHALPPEHDGLSLSELVKLYPPLPVPEGGV